MKKKLKNEKTEKETRSCPPDHNLLLSVSTLLPYLSLSLHLSFSLSPQSGNGRRFPFDDNLHGFVVRRRPEQQQIRARHSCRGRIRRHRRRDSRGTMAAPALRRYRAQREAIDEVSRQDGETGVWTRRREEGARKRDSLRPRFSMRSLVQRDGAPSTIERAIQKHRPCRPPVRLLCYLTSPND